MHNLCQIYLLCYPIETDTRFVFNIRYDRSFFRTFTSSITWKKQSEQKLSFLKKKPIKKCLPILSNKL